MAITLTEKAANHITRFLERRGDVYKRQVAALINADAREIVWTSGATEANNLAIKGAAQFYKTKGRHIITVKTEHKSVLDTFRELEREGFEATYLDPQENGLITLEQLEKAIRPDTILDVYKRQPERQALHFRYRFQSPEIGPDSLVAYYTCPVAPDGSDPVVHIRRSLESIRIRQRIRRQWGNPFHADGLSPAGNQ